MEIKFNNIQELYERVFPALKLRKKELKSQNIEMGEIDIWNYFSTQWQNCSDLVLSKIVDDILNKEIENYDDLI